MRTLVQPAMQQAVPHQYLDIEFQALSIGSTVFWARMALATKWIASVFNDASLRSG
jgi:hypothetical protein